MIRSLESLHSHGILHRDIKPANFCLAFGSDGIQLDVIKLYLIDFGLSRKFTNNDGITREERASVGFRGTARYASINAHCGRDLGRVDDLWSLFYMTIEFLTGTLPWKGKNKDIIGNMKQELTNADLFKGQSEHLNDILQHLLSLKYADLPNYKLIENAFQKMYEETMHTSQSQSTLDIEPDIMSLDKQTRSNISGLEQNPFKSCIKAPPMDRILERKESTTLLNDDENPSIDEKNASDPIQLTPK